MNWKLQTKSAHCKLHNLHLLTSSDVILISSPHQCRLDEGSLRSTCLTPSISISESKLTWILRFCGKELERVGTLSGKKLLKIYLLKTEQYLSPDYSYFIAKKRKIIIVDNFRVPFDKRWIWLTVTISVFQLSPLFLTDLLPLHTVLALDALAAKNAELHLCFMRKYGEEIGGQINGKQEGREKWGLHQIIKLERHTYES